MKKFITKNKFRVAALLVAATCAFPVALAGCGEPENPDIIIGDDGDIIVAPGSSATKVTFWANCDSTELEVFSTIVNNFNTANAGAIEVRLVPKSGSDYSDTLGITLNGSNAPDVFYVGDSGYKSYAELGYLYDITDFVEQSQIYNVEEMWDNVVTRYKYDTQTLLAGTETGRYYGVPKDIGPTVIYYNETYFNDAGITVISVDAADLDAFNGGARDDRGKTKTEYGITGTVKEKGYFEIDGKFYFNNQVPMSWEETVACSNKVQNYMQKTLGKTNGYGYFTEWWFNYGWSVGGNCIQQIPTDDANYRGYYYDFTLMDDTANYIVADNYEGEVTVGSNKYSAGEIIEYTDKINLSAYAKTTLGGETRKGTYTVTNEVKQLAQSGTLVELPSQREAFTEFVRLAAKTSTLVDTVDGENLYGYGITPYPTSIGGDSGKVNAFINGQVAMLVDGRWDVTEFRKSIDTDSAFEWDVAPLPMYKQYDDEGNITVHGIEAGHSGSVALCISSKTKVANAAWKFIEYCASVEGQTLQADAGFAIPLQKTLAKSETFLQSNQNPRNSKIFIDATEYEEAGDWWFLKDNEWIDAWANDLNGSVRNGTMTLSQFYDGTNYKETFAKLSKYSTWSGK